MKLVWHKYSVDANKKLAPLFPPGVISKLEIALYETNHARKQAEEVYNYPMELPELPQMAEKYFPPCMTTMLSRFTRDCELKHEARKQLTLFLKDIGLKKDDILMIYQKNYSGNPKQYEVINYMKHLLGLSGSFKNYKSYNCKQIQDYPPAIGYEHCHGCYFKTQSERQVKYDMTRQGFAPENIQTVCDLRKNNQYTAACAEHLRQRYQLGASPRHLGKPNDYYNIARCGRGNTDVDIEDLVRLDPDLLQAINEEDWTVDPFEDEVNQILKKRKTD